MELQPTREKQPGHVLQSDSLNPLSVSLEEVAKKMHKIDICMLTTTLEDGELASRPMSCNGDVDYNGHSYFFSSDAQGLVSEIERNPHVNLGFTGEKTLLGRRQTFVSVMGHAELIRDAQTLDERSRSLV